MKRISLLMVAIFWSVLYFFFNHSNKVAHTTLLLLAENNQAFFDWEGTYRGVLPCAGCEGIQTTLSLEKNRRYHLQTKYLGKQNHPQEYAGSFSWNTEGTTITLDHSDRSVQGIRYVVGENTLTQLDRNGNKIAGGLAHNYILSKTDDTLLEKYWKLTELNGQPVIVDSSYIHEPHIVFKGNKQFIGYGGCNSISGTYTLESTNKITLSNVTTTKMACTHLDVETLFLHALQKADNYSINGNVLELNKAKTATLARFRVVNLK